MSGDSFARSVAYTLFTLAMLGAVARSFFPGMVINDLQVGAGAISGSYCGVA